MIIMRTIILLVLFSCSLLISAQNNFEKYFIPKILRFDFMLAGNSSNTVVYPVEMKQEPHWGGSNNSLTDNFNSGNFKYEVFDDAGNRLIYSRAFCTLYQEWQTTAEAKTTRQKFL